METRIAKKSRFQIVKLEERVAPAPAAFALALSNVPTAVLTVVAEVGPNSALSMSNSQAVVN